MASSLFRTSVGRGSAFRRVVSAAAAPAPASASAASGGKGLAVRRATSLPPSSLRRLSTASGAKDQPPANPAPSQTPKSPTPNEKVLELLKEILATGGTSLPQDVVIEIFLSAIHARQEAYRKELSRSF